MACLSDQWENFPQNEQHLSDMDTTSKGQHCASDMEGIEEIPALITSTRTLPIAQHCASDMEGIEEIPALVTSTRTLPIAQHCASDMEGIEEIRTSTGNLHKDTSNSTTLC